MKKNYLAILGLFITILMYSIVAFAYMHNTFTTKDIFAILCKRLDRIENKIDLIIGGK